MEPNKTTPPEAPVNQPQPEPAPTEPTPSPAINATNTVTPAAPKPEVSPASPMAIPGGQKSEKAAWPPKTPPSKKNLLVVAAVVALFAGVGGYIFGFYLPNQPDNVWNSGLKNSGKAITKVVDDLTAKDRVELLKKTEIVVSAEVNGAGYDFTGSANSKLDGDKSVTTSKLSTSDKSDLKMNLQLDLLADVPEGKIYPDIYFKIAGLKSLGEDSLFASFNKYDDKWISVSSTYLESLYEQEEKPKEKQEPINSGDVTDLAKAVSEVSNEYLFTSNKDKAVLVNKGYKGKETVDGVDTFRYEVTVDKAHAKDYCKALSNRLLDLAIAKKLSGGDTEALKKEKESVEKDCNRDVDDSIKEGEVLEAWVNTKYKIMHKIRKYNGSDKTIYTEVGQIYKGGSSLSFFTNYHDDGEKSDVKFVMDVDTKTIVSKGTLTMTQKGDDSYDAKVTLEVKPYKGDVKVEKPTGAIDIQVIMEELGFGGSADGSVNGANTFRDFGLGL